MSNAQYSFSFALTVVFFFNSALQYKNYFRILCGRKKSAETYIGFHSMGWTDFEKPNLVEIDYGSFELGLFFSVAQAT